MSIKSDKILQQALAISASERAWLAQCLIASIEEPPVEAVEQEWLELARERAEQLRRGEVKSVSWEEIKQKLYA